MRSWCHSRTSLSETSCTPPETIPRVRQCPCPLVPSVFAGYLIGPKFRCVSVERTVVVGFSEQRLDWQEDCSDLQWEREERISSGKLLRKMWSLVLLFRVCLDQLASFWRETRAISPFTKTSFAQEWSGAPSTITYLVQCRPFLFENIEAYVAVVVHVRMEAGCGELDWGRLVGITWEANVGSSWTHQGRQWSYLLGILVWVCMWDLRIRTPSDLPQFQSRRGDYLRQERQKCPAKWESKFSILCDTPSIAPSLGVQGRVGVWDEAVVLTLSEDIIRDISSVCSLLETCWVAAPLDLKKDFLNF